MRRAMTREETLLWKHLRGGALGVKFRRQHHIGPYIVDFACIPARLVVEVDGSQHAESSYDSRRDRYLRRRGFVVLRFWNEDVWENIFWTVFRIREVLAEQVPGLEPPRED